MRGVIHPSFPLRGRWERPALVIEQAPSPSLADLCKSSIGMRPRFSDSARCGPNPWFPSRFKIPFFLFMFRLSFLIFAALTCCINPVSGERSPASGIELFLPNSPHMRCVKIKFHAYCKPFPYMQIWTNDPFSAPYIPVIPPHLKHYDTFPEQYGLKSRNSLDAVECQSPDLMWKSVIAFLV